MKRIAALTTALALSAPLAASADPPKSESSQPESSKPESSKPSAEKQGEKPAANPQVERPLKLQPGAPRAQAHVLPSTVGAPLPARGAWGDGKSPAEHYIEQTDKVAKLTDEQKLKIREIFEKREQDLKEVQAASNAKMQKLSGEMTEAYKNKNQEAIAKIQKAYQEAYAPVSELYKTSNADLHNVLTKEQQAKVRENRFTTLLQAYAPGVQLTDAQAKQLKEEAGYFTDQFEERQRSLPSVLDKLLTEEQAAKLLKQRAVTFAAAQFQFAKLTPEQLRKIEEQAAELLKGHKRSSQLDPTIYNKLSTFANGLLTDEQREAMKQPRFGTVGAGGGWVALGGTAGGAQPNPGAQAKPGAPAQGQNVRVNQVPGGGVQVFITEGGAGGVVASGTVQLEQQKELQVRMAEMAKQAQASHRDMLRQRVKRQRELTKQAAKLLKQLDELKPEEQAKAQQLFMQIEQTQAQLQQTFGHPGMFGGVIGGGGMVGPEGGVWSVKTWPDGPGVVEVNGQRIAPPGAAVPPQQPTSLRPNNAAPPSPETVKALEELRKQVDQLRGEVRKLNEKIEKK